MKRRSFIKKIGIGAAGIIGAPYILPSGRLFAATGERLVNHVVLCLFAGGVRNLDSVMQQDGNLMKNTFYGSSPISSDIAPSMESLPGSPILGSKLQDFGTLFKNFRYKNGPAGHYAAHTVALTGRYVDTNIELRRPPEFPTVFELFRKHSSPNKNALDAWWVSNSLGPYPFLNYSTYPGYGSMYGANFIQPTTVFSQQGYNLLGSPKNFTQEHESFSSDVKSILNKSFNNSFSSETGISNPVEDAEILRSFITKTLDEGAAGDFINPWGAGNAMNNDMLNVFFAEKIIKQFQPELTVVNMQDVDVCHFNFSLYANNLRKADFALAHLWSTIQNTPGMADDTLLIVVPEHGRNLNPNTVIDENGRYALDHTAIDNGGDQMSRDIFCMVVGPSGVVYQGQEISDQTGESIDVVPTIAHALGFLDQIPSHVKPHGRVLNEAFN